jgi:hypothetical protein
MCGALHAPPCLWEGAHGAHREAWPGTLAGRYRDPNTGRELSKTFARRADAERFLALTEADKAHGSWIDPAAGRTPFGT